MSLHPSFNSTNSSNDTCRATVQRVNQEIRIILTVAYGVLICLILYFNSVLIRSLRRQQKTRVGNLFLILSISDLGVALVCAPAAIVIFLVSTKGLCQFQPYLAFFLTFPITFSMIMTMIISVDRCMLITAPNLHSKFGKRFFVCLIPISFFVSATIGCFMGMNAFNTSSYIPMVATLAVFMFLIGATQIYLIWYVRRKMARMESSRHSNIDYNKRLTVTVAMMFFCAFLCNIPWLLLFSVATLHTFDGPSKKIIDTLASFASLVFYSNSFVNAVIILKRSSKLNKAG